MNNQCVSSIVGKMVNSRLEEVLEVVSIDDVFTKAESKFDLVMDRVSPLVKDDLYDEITMSVNSQIGAAIEVAYRIGLAHGYKLTQELADLDVSFQHSLAAIELSRLGSRQPYLFNHSNK